MRLILLLIASSASQLALGSDWNSVTTPAPPGDEVLVETESITDSVLGRKAWVKMRFAKPKKVDAVIDKKAAGKEYVESITLSRFDCDQRTMVILQGTFLDANGGVVASTDSPMMEDVDIPPDTVGEAIMKFVCSWKAGKKP